MARSLSPDYPNQHRRHQHERQSPERRPSRDPRDLEPQPPSRPPKRKSEQHHHDRERKRDRDRECEKEHDHHDLEDDHHRQKRHLSESSSANPSTQTTALAKPAKPASSATSVAAAAKEDTKPLVHHHHKESSSTLPWSSRPPLRLSVRNSFFKNVFLAKDRGSSLMATRFELKELAKEFDVGLDALLAVLGYVYSGKLRSLPKAFASAWTTLALMSIASR